jgi:hypothetical protein
MLALVLALVTLSLAEVRHSRGADSLEFEANPGPASRAACHQVDDLEKYFQTIINKISLWQQKKIDRSLLESQITSVWSDIAGTSAIVSERIATSENDLDRRTAAETSERALSTINHCKNSLNDYIEALNIEDSIDFIENECIRVIRDVNRAYCTTLDEKCASKARQCFKTALDTWTVEEAAALKQIKAQSEDLVARVKLFEATFKKFAELPCDVMNKTENRTIISAAKNAFTEFENILRTYRSNVTGITEGSYKTATDGLIATLQYCLDQSKTVSPSLCQNAFKAEVDGVRAQTLFDNGSIRIRRWPTPRFGERNVVAVSSRIQQALSAFWSAYPEGNEPSKQYMEKGRACGCREWRTLQSSSTDPLDPDVLCDDQGCARRFEQCVSNAVTWLKKVYTVRSAREREISIKKYTMDPMVDEFSQMSCSSIANSENKARVEAARKAVDSYFDSLNLYLKEKEEFEDAKNGMLELAQQCAQLVPERSKECAIIYSGNSVWHINLIGRAINALSSEKGPDPSSARRFDFKLERCGCTHSKVGVTCK